MFLFGFFSVRLCEAETTEEDRKKTFSIHIDEHGCAKIKGKFETHSGLYFLLAGSVASMREFDILPVIDSQTRR